MLPVRVDLYIPSKREGMREKFAGEFDRGVLVLGLMSRRHKFRRRTNKAATDFGFMSP